MYGEDFHPIMKMAENAVTLQALIGEVEVDDTALKMNAIKSSIDAWDKVAQYTEPKLKAVEMSGGTESELTIKVTNYANNNS